jgi:hypothetical protein
MPNDEQSAERGDTQPPCAELNIPMNITETDIDLIDKILDAWNDLTTTGDTYFDADHQHHLYEEGGCLVRRLRRELNQ